MKRSATRLFAVGILAIGICSPRPALAAADGDAVSRIYDVHELIVSFPDFSTASSGSGSSTCAVRTKESDSSAREAIVHQLTDALSIRLSPDEPAIRVTEADGKLAVNATADQQQRIARAIEQMKAECSTEISCESQLFWFKDESKLPRALAERLWTLRTASARSGLLLSAKEKQSMWQEVGSTIDATQVTAPRLTTFNGQTANVVVGTSRAFTASYDRDGEKWKPHVDQVSTGLSFDVRGTATADHGVAVLYRSEITRLLDLTTAPFAPANDPAVKIDIPTVEKGTSDILRTIPAGQSLLLAMPVTTSGPVKQPAKWAYVLVTPSVVAEPNPVDSSK